MTPLIDCFNHARLLAKCTWHIAQFMFDRRRMSVTSLVNVLHDCGKASSLDKLVNGGWHCRHVHHARPAVNFSRCACELSYQLWPLGSMQIHPHGKWPSLAVADDGVIVASGLSCLACKQPLRSDIRSIINIVSDCRSVLLCLLSSSLVPCGYGADRRSGQGRTDLNEWRLAFGAGETSNTTPK